MRSISLCTGANLRSAIDPKEAGLVGRADERTTWPSDFDPLKHGVVFRDAKGVFQYFGVYP
jgi:hypothetical protein